jgi:transcriptional regulator with XRE-family HTH domain
MRQLRLRLGLTQEEVARLAGCSRVTVNKTEGGYPASRLVRRSIWQALEQAAIEAEIKTEEASEKDLADLPDLG